jgi:phytoene dehydrogenase-like protein
MRDRRIAVIGGGLAGLTAAGLLARAGAHVTLFEAAATLGGKATAFTSDGVRLDLGPTLLTMPAIVRDTFARLEATDLLAPIVPLALHCEYRFASGRRYRAWAELARSIEEAGAFGSGEAGGLRRFYADAEVLWHVAGEPYLEAPYDGLGGFLGRVGRRGLSGALRGLRMGTLAQLAARHFRSPELRQFVGRFATYAGASPFAASEVFATIAHLEHVAGVHHVVGGIGSLAAALQQAIVRLGVAIEPGQRVSWVTRGARLLVGGRAFDAVVTNADPLAAAGRDRGPLALSGYVLLARAPERLPLPHHLVCFSRDYETEFRQLFSGQPAEDPTLYVCHPAATDPTMAPGAASGLYLMTNAPPLAPGAARSDRETLRRRCLARLRQHLPEIADRLEILHERVPEDLAGLGAPRGSIYGYLPHGRLAALRRPRMRSATPGVFFAGGGTHPGGGVPLVMLSGRYAAAMALQHVGLAVAA